LGKPKQQPILAEIKRRNHLFLSNGKLLTVTVTVQDKADVPKRHGDVQQNRRPAMLANLERR
jgi:hypothetical protein